MKRFRNLTPAQFAVFGQITIGNDRGHQPSVLHALERKGLIERRVVETGGGWSIYHFDVPLAVHMEWCQWCADQRDEDIA